MLVTVCLWDLLTRIILCSNTGFSGEVDSTLSYRVKCKLTELPPCQSYHQQDGTVCSKLGKQGIKGDPDNTY